KSQSISSWFGTIQALKSLEVLGLSPGDAITLSFYAKVPSNAPGRVQPRITCYRADNSYTTLTGGIQIAPGQEGFTSYGGIIPNDSTSIRIDIQKSDASRTTTTFTIQNKKPKAEKGNKTTA